LELQFSKTYIGILAYMHTHVHTIGKNHISLHGAGPGPGTLPGYTLRWPGTPGTLARRLKVPGVPGHLQR
jgi:hypothetical protein